VFFGRALDFDNAAIPQELKPPFLRLVRALYDKPSGTLLFPALLQAWQNAWGGFLVVERTKTDEDAVAGDVGAKRRHFVYAIDQLDRLLTAVPLFSGTRRSWLAKIPTRSGHAAWQVNTLKLLPEPWKGLGLGRRRLLDRSAQPVQPWPDYYHRWERQVAAYRSHLEDWEKGKSPDWTRIEKKVHGQVQSTTAPFT